jgi:uncharacterized membrane protein YidH (DUF202 family)
VHEVDIMASVRPDGATLAQRDCMRTRQIVGAILIVIGLVSLLMGGISWTRNKTVVDIGPIEARTEERKTLPIPPVVGAIVLVGGVALLVTPSRRRI